MVSESTCKKGPSVVFDPTCTIPSSSIRPAPIMMDAPPTPPTPSVISDTGSKGHQQSLSTTAIERKLPIAFSRLSYEVGKKDKKKKILDDVDGVFQPGRMCALMGPSGCGKTTLIDVLSGRKNTGKISGTVYFGGVTCVHEQLKTLCGYVEQFDNLVQELTVEEMFMYTAELKLPKLNKAERTARVEECISALGLATCRKTVIGGALIRGISGGQLKRTNIGLSLITRPPVIFLDEPTSGLDSFMAHEVCVCMSMLLPAVLACALPAASSRGPSPGPILAPKANYRRVPPVATAAQTPWDSGEVGGSCRRRFAGVSLTSTPRALRLPSAASGSLTHLSAYS